MNHLTAIGRAAYKCLEVNRKSEEVPRLDKRVLAVREPTATVNSSEPKQTCPNSPRQVLPIAPVPSQTRCFDEPVYRALEALAEGENLADHLPALRELYGSLALLAPYLEKTVSRHPDVVCSEAEWLDVLRAHPHLLAKVPPAFLSDALCVEATARTDTFQYLPAGLSESRRRSICIQACRRNLFLFAHLAREYMNAELCQAACKRHFSLFEYVPDQYRSVQLCASVCIRSPRIFATLSENHKSYRLARLICKKKGEVLEYVACGDRDARLCASACRSSGLAIRHAPPAVLSKHPELYEIACQNNGMALRYVPATHLLKHPELCTVACQNNGEALQWVPPKLRSLALCRLAVSRAGEALKSVPAKHKNDDLYLLACSHSGAALQYVPKLQRTAALCSAAFHAPEKSHCAFAATPERWRTQAMYAAICGQELHWLENIPDHIDRRPLDDMAVAKCGLDALQHIPARHRTAQLYAKALYRGYSRISLLPQQYATLPVFLDKAKNGMHIGEVIQVKHYLDERQYRLFITLYAAHSSEMQLEIITCAAIPGALKAEVIHFLRTGQSPCLASLKTDSTDLYSSQTPIVWHAPNRAVDSLLLACYQSPGYEPPYRQAGRQLQVWLAEQCRELAVSEAMPVDHQPSLRGIGQRVGGRTLKIEEGNTALCYKFHKQGELLEELWREGLVHRYRKEHPNSRLAQMVSALPYDPFFFELDEQHWPVGIEQWPDKPCIQSRPDQSRYINVYRYRAPAGYHHYAHHKESGAGDPWQKPEAGILAACHDMGLMAGLGLPLTSMLPAFHDSMSNRAWCAYHSLLGYQPFGSLPGTFGAWNTVATEYPDIGYSGLRDVGDFEPFGAINSILCRKDSSKPVQAVGIAQKIAFANSLCENVLAAVLIRSRLRQQDPDYHIDNPDAVKETAAFIQRACGQFVAGMYAEAERPDLLPALMQFNDFHFQNWLDRATREVVYWTAAQPKYATPDTPAFSPEQSRWDHSRCYAIDLRNTGRLCPMLYPDQLSKSTLQYPEAFHNKDKHLNLGINSTVFPLMSLCKGLTALNAGLLRAGPSDTPERSEQPMEL